MALDALQLAVAAVDASQIADRGVFQHHLRGVGVLFEATLDAKQLSAPPVVFEVLPEERKVGFLIAGHFHRYPAPT